MYDSTYMGLASTPSNPPSAVVADDGAKAARIKGNALL